MVSPATQVEEKKIKISDSQRYFISEAMERVRLLKKSDKNVCDRCMKKTDPSFI